MGFSFSAEHFANISSHQKSSVFIYKDAKATDNVSEIKFFFTPLFILVSDNSSQPIVGVDGKTVEVLFQCFTQQLQNLVLNEVRARLNTNELKKNQISLIPITGIKIRPESEDVNSYIFPDTGDAIVDLIPLSEQHEAKFKFSDEEKAKQFAERIKNKKEDFYVELNIPSVSVTDDVIEIKASDFKIVDWKNFVNDKNADKNIDADNQYFTLDQLSDTFESILRRINITVVIENKEPGASQLTLDEKNKLLDIFIKDLTKVVVEDFPPSENTDFFIGKESFNPDVINEEKTSITEAMTSAIESVIDKAEEDIRDIAKWNSRESSLDQLDQAYTNKKGGGGTEGGFKLGNFIGISGKASGGGEFTSDTLKKMTEEVKIGSSDKFSSQTRERMRSELKDLLQTHSNFEWEFKGEKIIPKKIKLRRIISGEFKADHQLFQRVRKIERSVSKIGFSISSNRNVISQQELSISMNAVVFSVSGRGHVSEGNPTVLSYSTNHVNFGEGWQSSSSTFNVPVTGIYFFSISFVKDAYKNEGTEDDVYIHLRKNASEIVGSAWSGEGAGKRGTGTYTVAVKLQKGDIIDTLAASVGKSGSEYKRHIHTYHFTGHLIAGTAES